jgi:hypothetical protein
VWIGSMVAAFVSQPLCGGHLQCRCPAQWDRLKSCALVVYRILPSESSRRHGLCPTRGPARRPAGGYQAFLGGHASQAVAETGSPHKSTVSSVPWCAVWAAAPRR